MLPDRVRIWSVQNAQPNRALTNLRAPQSENYFSGSWQCLYEMLCPTFLQIGSDVNKATGSKAKAPSLKAKAKAPSLKTKTKAPSLKAKAKTPSLKAKACQLNPKDRSRPKPHPPRPRPRPRPHPSRPRPRPHPSRPKPIACQLNPKDRPRPCSPRPGQDQGLNSLQIGSQILFKMQQNASKFVE